MAAGIYYEIPILSSMHYYTSYIDEASFKGLAGFDKKFSQGTLASAMLFIAFFALRNISFESINQGTIINIVAKPSFRHKHRCKTVIPYFLFVNRAA